MNSLRAQRDDGLDAGGTTSRNDAGHQGDRDEQRDGGRKSSPGSSGLTPKSSADAVGPPARARPMPQTVPIASRTPISIRNSLTTSRAVAPRAMRMPISPVRRDTVYATRPV